MIPSKKLSCSHLSLNDMRFPHFTAFVVIIMDIIKCAVFSVTQVGPVPDDSYNNYSYSTSSIVLSQRPLGNEGIVVASLPNNSEEPLPVEPQSTPVIIQVSTSHSVVYLLYK